MPEAPSLGLRLRAERVRRDVSLRQLARQVGVSASMISQIETGKSRPSVRTLYAITTALGLSLEGLFSGGAGLSPSVPAQLAEAVGGTPVGAVAIAQAFGAFAGRRLGPLVRPGERPQLQLESGVTWERLGQLPHTDVDFLLARYPPGAASSADGERMRHTGCEYGYLLAGELVVVLGFDELVMQPGDAVSFESSVPHAYRNDAGVEAVGLWFAVRTQ
jgi:transcriptional regulator with XRE-family HTH domain/quercetin dioxygenase-like cupin family protein